MAIHRRVVVTLPASTPRRRRRPQTPGRTQALHRGNFDEF